MNITEQLPSTVFSASYRRIAERETDRILARHRMIFAAHRVAAEKARHEDNGFIHDYTA